MEVYNDPADLIENWVRGGQEEVEPEMVQLSVRIPKTVMQGMDEMADTMGYSRSSLVRDLLASAFLRANERLSQYQELSEGADQ